MFNKLFHDFDAMSRHMASRLCPEGYEARWDAPNSYEALQASRIAAGHLIVARDNSENTIYDDPEGNWAFRAWHDKTHLRVGAGFDRSSELAVFRQQCEDMRNYWPGFIPYSHEHFAGMVNIIRCEIVGQFDYNETQGAYPQYQRKFTEAYLLGEH